MKKVDVLNAYPVCATLEEQFKMQQFQLFFILSKNAKLKIP
jgi:hypothetical protein